MTLKNYFFNMENLPFGAQYDKNAPYNKKETNFEQLTENYINHILHESTMPFDEIAYLIDLLRDSKHYEKIDDILLHFNK